MGPGGPGMGPGPGGPPGIGPGGPGMDFMQQKEIITLKCAVLYPPPPGKTLILFEKDQIFQCQYS